jgi:hypothetical protein
MVQCGPKWAGADWYVLNYLKNSEVSVLALYVISVWDGTVYTI